VPAIVAHLSLKLGASALVCGHLFVTRMRLALCWQAGDVASEASGLKLNHLWVKVHSTTEPTDLHKTSSTHAQRAAAAGGELSHDVVPVS